MTQDPVCRMTIDTARAAGQAQYQGRTYHFCSEHCRSRFLAAPAQYAPPSPGQGGERGRR